MPTKPHPLYSCALLWYISMHCMHPQDFRISLRRRNNLFQFVRIINGPVHMPFNKNALNQDINLITKNGGGCGIGN